jgi:hypothetical protein
LKYRQDLKSRTTIKEQNDAPGKQTFSFNSTVHFFFPAAGDFCSADATGTGGGGGALPGAKARGGGGGADILFVHKAKEKAFLTIFQSSREYDCLFQRN